MPKKGDAAGIFSNNAANIPDSGVIFKDYIT